MKTGTAEAWTVDCFSALCFKKIPDEERVFSLLCIHRTNEADLQVLCTYFLLLCIFIHYATHNFNLLYVLDVKPVTRPE